LVLTPFPPFFNTLRELQNNPVSSDGPPNQQKAPVGSSYKIP